MWTEVRMAETGTFKVRQKHWARKRGHSKFGRNIECRRLFETLNVPVSGPRFRSPRFRSPFPDSEWIGAVDGLTVVHARLRPVVIENLPALDLIRREDGPGTLFYCDPPYLHATRAVRNAYAFEMTEGAHRELLGLLRQCRSKVMLSGYPSELYDRTLAGWTRHTFDLPNHAAGGARKGRETEVLWCNF